jgi:hypothetical protein
VDEKLRTRFEARVDRSGQRHRWTGSRTTDGAGKLKVDGRTVSARRVVWELERGPLSPAPGEPQQYGGRPSSTHEGVSS